MNEDRAEEHVLRSLKSALTKKKSGNSRDYEKIIKALEASPSSTLVYWFRALVKCISLVDGGCTELIQILLRYTYDGGAKANEAFEQMITNLVSSNQRFIVMICDKLATDMRIPKREGENEEVFAEEELTGPYAESIAIRVIGVSPSALTYLLKSLMERFPHRTNSILDLDQYTMHMLTIANHFIVVRERVMEFLVNQIIDIDAEISIPDDDDQDDLFFDLDESFGGSQEQTPSKAVEMAEKLDDMMNRIFDFCNVQIDMGKAPDDLIRGQLRVFDSVILTTQKVKHPQFLMFFMCSKSPIYSQQFLGYLIQKIIDNSSSILTKTTAIAYIASYIARAKFISHSLISSTMITLCTWAAAYARENAENKEDFERHCVFYHLCQAIFYMFCFRFEQILDRTTKDECLSTFSLIEIIQSSINPFKHCSPFVVRELTEIARDLNITKLTRVCDVILNRNNATVSHTRYIEASFPFDPYLLKNSSQWINDNYCSWEDRGAQDENSQASEDYLDLTGSVPDDFDVMMSFTPETTYDISIHFPRSPVF